MEWAIYLRIALIKWVILLGIGNRVDDMIKVSCNNVGDMIKNSCNRVGDMIINNVIKWAI